MSQNVLSDLSTLAEVPYSKRHSLAYSAAFFSFLGFVSLYDSRVIPIAVTAALVLPFRFFIYYGATFERAEYFETTPLIAKLTNYRFLVLVGGFAAVAALSVAVGDPFLWDDFGPVAFAIGTAAVVGITWSEALYERNYYYDSWHLDVRFALFALGALSLLTPLFLPLFVVAHHVAVQQFNHTPIGKLGSKLGYTHTVLPLTMVLILGAFAFTDLIFEIQPYIVKFLLLCGYAGQYFYSGVEKLRFGGPVHYVTQNNPFFISMNAYKTGWFESLPEETVARIGAVTDRIKPALNAFVLLVELGTLFVLASFPVAMAISALTLILHLTIFGLTGDNFWKWMFVNVAVIGGLILFGDPSAVIFTEIKWFGLSVAFILLASAWMKPKRLGWLDSPYFEYYEVEADYPPGDGDQTVNTAVFKPWDDVISQGLAGHFTYLGDRPRITHNWGDVDDVNAHKYLMDIYPRAPSSTEVDYLSVQHGSDLHDEAKTEELKAVMEMGLEHERASGANRLLQYISPPREWYHHGLPGRLRYEIPDDSVPLSVYRVDGMWTDEGFDVIRREKLFTVSRDEG
jgi:hypothetical protein